jgi:hypothetical protein
MAIRYCVRFLVLLMRGIYRYCHSQQIILVVLLFVSTSAWGLITREQSFAEIMKNPWRPAFPVILVTCLVAIPLVIQAAKGLNREIAKSIEEDRPRVIIVGSENVLTVPSKVPGWAIGSAFVVTIIGLTGLAFWAGFSPANMTLRMSSLSPPQPPSHPPEPPGSDPGKNTPPSGFIQFDRTELVDNPSTIEPGRRLGFNVFLTNPGKYPARRAERETRYELVASTEAAKKQVESKFDKRIAIRRREHPVRIADIGAIHGVWSTIGQESLSDQDAAGILDGSLRVYILWWAKWDDPLSKNPSARGCWWLQQPSDKVIATDKLIWHFCE